jgi:hypothetical protein
MDSETNGALRHGEDGAESDSAKGAHSACQTFKKVIFRILDLKNEQNSKITHLRDTVLFS